MSASRHTEYQRRFRAENPSYYAAERKVSKARQRALVRLGQRHPEELEELLNKERAKEGLPPVNTVPRGRPPAGQRAPLAS